MPRFEGSILSDYGNIDAIADRNGLVWDGNVGSPYDVSTLIDSDLLLDPAPREFGQLFDHTIRFRPKGRGRRKPVMAITSPYLRDSDKLRDGVRRFCALYGLAARVGDEEYRVYLPTPALPVVLWRPDLHILV